MTRICSYCKKPMGYKCHWCGGELERLHPKSPDYEERGTCDPCSGSFELSEGGTTHGICDECIEKEKEKVNELP